MAKVAKGGLPTGAAAPPAAGARKSAKRWPTLRQRVVPGRRPSSPNAAVARWHAARSLGLAERHRRRPAAVKPRKGDHSAP